jgi:transcriptional regulator with XRE-family HTH domain
MAKNDQKNKRELKFMTFRCYYDTLGDRTVVAPKRDFVKEMAELCMVSTKTIRGYLAGTYQPDALRKKIISEKLGISEEQLFPPKEEKEA